MLNAIRRLWAWLIANVPDEGEFERRQRAIRDAMWR